MYNPNRYLIICVHCFNNSNFINPKIRKQVLIISTNENEKKNIYILKMILYQWVGRYLAKGNILIILKGAMYN